MKIAVKIVKETKKAKLVEDSEGRQAWVQNRSFKDGQVNESVFKKGVDFLIKKAAFKKEVSDQRNSMFSLSEVVRETENAIALKVDCFCIVSEKTVKRTVWLPKSQCKSNGGWMTKGWLIKSKVAELAKELNRDIEVYGLIKTPVLSFSSKI